MKSGPSGVAAPSGPYRFSHKKRISENLVKVNATDKIRLQEEKQWKLLRLLRDSIKI